MCLSQTTTGATEDESTTRIIFSPKEKSILISPGWGCGPSLPTSRCSVQAHEPGHRRLRNRHASGKQMYSEGNFRFSDPALFVELHTPTFYAFENSMFRDRNNYHRRLMLPLGVCYASSAPFRLLTPLKPTSARFTTNGTKRTHELTLEGVQLSCCCPRITRQAGPDLRLYPAIQYA